MLRKLASMDRAVALRWVLAHRPPLMLTPPRGNPIKKETISERELCLSEVTR